MAHIDEWSAACLGSAWLAFALMAHLILGHQIQVIVQRSADVFGESLQTSVKHGGGSVMLQAAVERVVFAKTSKCSGRLKPSAKHLTGRRTPAVKIDSGRKTE